MVGGRRVGVIVRAGEAVEVTRQSGSVFVATVDDGGTGVELLASLVAHNVRGRARRGRDLRRLPVATHPFLGRRGGVLHGVG